MGFKIFGQEEDKQVFLKLRPSLNDDGEVDLVAVDRDGDRVSQGSILTILNDGSLHLCSMVSTQIGLKLDEDGKVVINNK
jgi:hypothetical protein